MNTTDNDEESPLKIASRESVKECIISLVKGGTKVKVTSFFEGKPAILLEVTVMVSGAECFRLLLGNDISVNALLSTIVNAQCKNFNSLAKTGADVNVPVTQNGHLDSTTCLKILEQANDINLNDTTPVIMPMNVGENTCLELLLNSGADVNTTDGQGRTALMMTSTNKELVWKQLHHGAPVNKADDSW